MTSAEPIHTLADLDSWSIPGTALAVIGHPIKHSLSPAMHNAALARMAHTAPRFKDWKYVRFDIAPESLPSALEKFHARGFKGLNLTVPHKVIAFGLPSVSVTPAATIIGAVNTLLWTPQGWTGHNTDGHGFSRGLQEGLHRDLHGADVLLLGAGGAARSAAVECLQHGCARLWIANRTQANRDTLLAQLASLAGAIPLSGFDPASPPADLPAGALVINATSAGMKSDDPSPVDLAALPRPAGVYDMIYNPPETPLLAQARALGLPAANGLSMLVHQGARALEIWSQSSVPVDAMREAVVKAMTAS
ncbi:MAG TPA: shikimate dehydrogenase [Rariglobus sp.]|jgi:shikimate dehydrogenase|nr:shikimate dehydrogenase [Rariglobus sp.]